MDEPKSPIRELLTKPANYDQMTPEEKKALNQRQAEQLQRHLLDDVNLRFGHLKEVIH